MDKHLEVGITNGPGRLGEAILVVRDNQLAIEWSLRGITTLAVKKKHSLVHLY